MISVETLLSKPTIFWPTDGQSAEERGAAAVRFVLVATALLFAVERDVRIFGLGAVVIVMIYLLEHFNLLASPEYATGAKAPTCVKPTPSNPMGNFLLSDLVDQPHRGPACPDYSAQERALAASWPRDQGDYWGKRQSTRPWYTTASSTAVNDVKAFTDLTYPFASPHCREGSSYCSADHPHGRTPPSEHARATFAGANFVV